MAAKYLDLSGLQYFWNKIKTWVQNYAKVTTSEGTSTITIGNSTLTPVLKDGDKVLSDNNFTDALKTKLDGIASGAEVNQNAFTTIKVGSVDVVADSKTDTLEIAAASNSVASVTGDAANDKVTIDVDTDLSKYDNSTSGFITVNDIPEGAAASTTTPKMDSTSGGVVGTELAFARGDHQHPSDSTKANASELTITNGATADKKTIQLKTGTSQEVLIAHQDISGKVNTSTTVNGHALSSNVTVTKTDVGLGNVTNDAQIPLTQKGAANGVCPLNSSSMIDSAYLPSYVDDVVEAYPREGQTPLSATWLALDSASGTVITPTTGVIYVLMADSGTYSTNTQFRWGGTEYVKLNDGGVSAITNAEIDTIVAS